MTEYLIGWLVGLLICWLPLMAAGFALGGVLQSTLKIQAITRKETGNE